MSNLPNLLEATVLATPARRMAWLMIMWSARFAGVEVVEHEENGQLAWRRRS